MEEKLLTTEEVAAYFKVKKTTVTQKFIKEGLKYFPVGNRNYRYNKNDIIEFEEQKKLQASTDVASQYNRQIIYKKAPLINRKITNEMKVY